MGRMEERVDPGEGVIQSVAVEELHRLEGILVEATSTPPGMGSMAFPGVGRKLVEVLDHADHVASLGGMVGDQPQGRIVGSRRAIVRYDLAPSDGRRLLRAIEVMGEILFAAGASEVYPGLPDHPVVDDLTALKEAVSSADPRDLHLAAFHPTGTMRAGADSATHPVDEDGRLRGVDGVWVADACILPSCPEVNPQISIMALAQAVADRVVATT
jgi:hypothetical protein